MLIIGIAGWLGGQLWKRADELRKSDPSMTCEQSYTKAYRSESALAARVRQSASDALFA